MSENGGDEMINQEITIEDLRRFLENPMMIDTTTPLIPNQQSLNAIPKHTPKKSKTRFKIIQIDGFKIYRKIEKRNKKAIMQIKRKETENSEEKKIKEKEIAFLKEGFLKFDVSLQALGFSLDSFSTDFDEILEQETSIDNLDINDLQKVEEYLNKSIKLQKLKTKLDFIKTSVRKIQSMNQTIINNK
jgi:hypothetical protein